MSRSYNKHYIAWGKAKAGKANRGSRNWLAKRNSNGKISRRSHWLAKLQTLDQYIFYVRHHCMADGNNLSTSDMWDRKRLREYQKFLDGREETEDLIIAFATKLYNKDRSK